MESTTNECVPVTVIVDKIQNTMAVCGLEENATKSLRAMNATLTGVHKSLIAIGRVAYESDAITVYIIDGNKLLKMIAIMIDGMLNRW